MVMSGPDFLSWFVKLILDSINLLKSKYITSTASHVR